MAVCALVPSNWCTLPCIGLLDHVAAQFSLGGQESGIVCLVSLHRVPDLLGRREAQRCGSASKRESESSPGVVSPGSRVEMQHRHRKSFEKQASLKFQ